MRQQPRSIEEVQHAATPRAQRLERCSSPDHDGHGGDRRRGFHTNGRVHAGTRAAARPSNLGVAVESILGTQYSRLAQRTVKTLLA